MASRNAKAGRAWKMERASVNRQGRVRPKSDKYSKSDSKSRPMPGARSRIWVGGYTRSDGTKVEGYYREIANAGSR
ncbi:MAG: hypothetical protein ACXWPI_19645 [Ktedonobacterales bacterium]